MVYPRSAQVKQKNWWRYLIGYHTRFSQSPSLFPKSSGDQAVSSENVGQDSKERFSGILRQVCHVYDVLPPAYCAPGVISLERYAPGGFADIYKGQYAGKPVRIKAFRRQNTTSTKLTRRVRILTVWRKQAQTLPYFNRGSTVKVYDGNTSHIQMCYPS